ncbi:MAG: DUF1552 domain-containing protein, partial [Myxococcota bacterium]
LDSIRDRLLVVGNVNYHNYDFGDGHARGAMQALTATGPYQSGRGGGSEGGGISVDNVIAQQLGSTEVLRDRSLFLYAGRGGGWLDGPCVSFLGPNQRTPANHDPLSIYETLFGSIDSREAGASQALSLRQQSVNDLLREQLQALASNPRLSSADQQRLSVHQESIREIELTLSCRLDADAERALADLSPGFDSTRGDETLETARLHMDIATIAISCGLTRSVVIQIGGGNDGATRYENLDTGELMPYNFHYVSHRRTDHGNGGQAINGADVLHHMVDIQFARTFRHLVNQLSNVSGSNGSLLDHGVAVWYNDNRDGPPHGRRNVPWVLAGSASGFFRQGEYVRLTDDGSNHRRLLRTVAESVGVPAAGLAQIGDSEFNNDRLDELTV